MQYSKHYRGISKNSEIFNVVKHVSKFLNILRVIYLIILDLIININLDLLFNMFNKTNLKIHEIL